MKRKIKMLTAMALTAIMIINNVPSGSAAVRKPKLSKARCSIVVGESTKLVLKNKAKNANVTWKLTKKNVVKLGRQMDESNKSTVHLTGKKCGKTKVKVSYKTGTKKLQFSCMVTVSEKNTEHGIIDAANIVNSMQHSSSSAAKNPADVVLNAPSQNPSQIQSMNKQEVTALPVSVNTANPMAAYTQVPKMTMSPKPAAPAPTSTRYPKMHTMIPPTPSPIPTAVPQNVLGSMILNLNMPECESLLYDYQDFYEYYTYDKTAVDTIYIEPVAELSINTYWPDTEIYYYADTSGIDGLMTVDDLETEDPEWIKGSDKLKLTEDNAIVYIKLYNPLSGYTNYLHTDRIAFGEGLDVTVDNFRDSELRRYILDNFDLDKDGHIGYYERKMSRAIEKDNYNIKDYSGVNLFENLYWISLKYSRVSDVTLNSFINLEYVFLDDSSSVKSLKISDCPKLERVFSDGKNSELESLDISGCPMLENILINDAGLSTIRLSGCSALKWFSCQDNMLTELNLNECTRLYELYCAGNQLKTLKLNSDLRTLDCSNNSFETLDVSTCRNIYSADCTNNQLKQLYVPANHEFYIQTDEDVSIIEKGYVAPSPSPTPYIGKVPTPSPQPEVIDVLMAYNLDREEIAKDTTEITGEARVYPGHTEIEVKVGDNVIAKAPVSDTGEFSVEVNFSKCKVGDEVEVTVRYTGEKIPTQNIIDVTKKYRLIRYYPN